MFWVVLLLNIHYFSMSSLYLQYDWILRHLYFCCAFPNHWMRTVATDLRLVLFSEHYKYWCYTMLCVFRKVVKSTHHSTWHHRHTSQVNRIHTIDNHMLMAWILTMCLHLLQRRTYRCVRKKGTIIKPRLQLVAPTHTVACASSRLCSLRGQLSN